MAKKTRTQISDKDDRISDSDFKTDSGNARRQRRPRNPRRTGQSPRNEIKAPYSRGILPVSERTLVPGLSNITSWEDPDYLLVRNAAFTPTGTCAANIQAAYVLALKSIASFDLIKDWTDGEWTALKTMFTKQLELVNSYVAQGNIVRFASSYTSGAGNDTKGVWSDDAFLAFTQLLDANPLPILPGVLETVMALNPVVNHIPEWKPQSLPPGFMLYWAPHLSVTEALSYRDTLLNNVQGLNLLQKMKIPYCCVSGSQVLAGLTGRLITPSPSNEWAFHWNQQPLYYKSAASVYTYVSPQADPCNGDIANTQYYFAPGTMPSQLYGLTQLVCPYDATHNNIGAMTNLEGDAEIPGLTVAASSWNIAKIQFTGATTSGAIATSSSDDYGWLFGPMWKGAVTPIGSATLLCGHNPAFSTFYHQGTSASVWSIAFRDTLAMWMSTGQVTGNGAKKEVNKPR